MKHEILAALDRGIIDLAVFITEASAQTGTLVGSLPLVWCAASGWTPPTGAAAWPLIAIEEPCAIRGRALAVLDEHGIPATVVGEAAALGGVLNATRAGLGISLLALAGPPPEGLVEVRDLPPAQSISLTARARHGADPQAVQVALRVLQATLETRPSTLASDLTGGRSLHRRCSGRSRRIRGSPSADLWGQPYGTTALRQDP